MRGRKVFLGAAFLVATLLLTEPATADVASTVQGMNLRQKVGQLVMFSIQGTRLSSAEADVIRRHRLGGIILFARNYNDRQQLTALTARLQRVVRNGSGMGIGALISVDQEGGVVKRFRDMPPWRSAPELGRIGDPSVARRTGRSTASALRNAGVNIDLAPVADLDIGPNHVMRSRSFGSRPRKVARLATAFALGLQDRRVAATIKHFPGLGGSDINSDDGRAVVRRTRRQLRNVDGVPFQRAIDRGARVVMLSHAIYPNYGGHRPASLNRFISGTRLRAHMGFGGVAITDAIDASKWFYGGDVGKTCVGSVRAGVDVALLADTAHAGAECAVEIRRAVRAGDLRMARIDTAVTRILRLKHWLRVWSAN